MFRNRTESTLFWAGTVPETVLVLSLVPRLSLLCRQCCHFGVGKRTLRGWGWGVLGLDRRPAVRSRAPAAFTRDQM